MAGERTKDISRINITITPIKGSRRTLTAIHDWDSGESPEKATKRDPDVKGNTYIKIQPDKSRESIVTVKVGSQDEKYLDNLANEIIAFDLVVIDESNKLYKKQHTGKECYITKVPADPFRDGDTRAYSILCSEFKTKAL